MAHDLTLAIRQTLDHLQSEFDTVRTGRANPALVESVPIEVYGTKTPLQQLAAINAPEPRMLVVQPWDPSTVKEIEKALSQSGLGITPVVDGKVIRLPFPAMTEDRRRELVKTVKEKAEAAKVRIRTVREDVLKDLKRQETDGAISQDEAGRQRQNIQQEMTAAGSDIDRLTAAKEQEVMTV